MGEALARVDPDLQAMLDGDIAIALAEAGLAEQALARIESNLTRWPDDIWVRIHAGDAHAALADLDGAVAHFEAAVRMADETDDFETRSDAVERLMQIRQGSPKKQRRQTTNQRRRPKRHRNLSRRKRKR